MKSEQAVLPNRCLEEEEEEEEEEEGWRRLHNEELHNLQPSANIIRVIKE
jgi:hypothetical protein